MEVDYQVIKRYLDGNKRKGDKEKILSWFSSVQTEAGLRKGYFQYWHEELSNNFNIKGYDAEKVLGKIYHKIKIEESRLMFKGNMLKRVSDTISKVAAVLLIPLSIFLLVNRKDFIQTKNNIVYSEIYSPLGTRTMFSLPDGSSGYLNGGSALRFPAEFRGKSREVNLKGEAYFEILSNPERPFVVIGEHINVVARGTSFNMKVFPEDKTDEVALVKGQVDIFGKKDGKIQKLGVLEPDQMFVFDKKNCLTKFIKVDADMIIAWKEGKLVFFNEPFSQVVRELNRRYNINMIIKDPILEEYTYLATFEDESLDEVISLLKLSAPIEIRDLGRKKKPDGAFEKRTIELYYNPNS